MPNKLSRLLITLSLQKFFQIIVACQTKIDKPTANPERVNANKKKKKKRLTEYGLFWISGVETL